MWSCGVQAVFLTAKNIRLDLLCHFTQIIKLSAYPIDRQSIDILGVNYSDINAFFSE